MSYASGATVRPDGSFRILFVCTGNICRSPIAERLARQGLAKRLGGEADRVLVESAGTWGHDGSPMEPYAAQTLVALGGDPAGFSGRELEPGHVGAADLVLTATRDHSAAVTGMAPGAVGRTFTLKEFNRLSAVVDPDALPNGDVVARAHALVRTADRLRDKVPAPTPRADDIVDPYGAPLHVHRICAHEIATALRQPLDALTGCALRV